MVQHQYGPETSYEERAERRLQILYSRKTRERQLFMHDLKEHRKQNDKYMMKTIVDSIGPTWYQALSVPQRNALDRLEFSIYQDILEGRPVRTAKVMHELGINPHPNNNDLWNCVYLGKDDPKEMLAQLFLNTYGHSIDGKRHSYCLNARLMFSAILYLGIENLIVLLRERFKPDAKPASKAKKPKAKKQPPLASPYLQKMIAAMYDPPRYKRKPPAPLPNLDELNEPYEEEPPIPKPPPPPPPPPPPKKRLPRSYCDKLAGVMTIAPYSDMASMTVKTVTRTSHRKVRGNMCVTEVKKTYGISMSRPKKSGRRKRPPAPTTGRANAQYIINGIFTIHGKSVYVLSCVTILPPHGELINGGFRLLNGDYINIHCGFRAHPPPPKPDPCDCVKKWQDTVFEYLRGTKCYCGHRYDYGVEGAFSPEELPFFQKATRNSPHKFNYETIYDIDEKHVYIEKEFKKVWDTDSMLHVDDGTQPPKKDQKKKKAKKSSTTCLGQNPQPEDYLKCALRLMRRVNVAARLPDIHLVPELKEWMRYRIYGPYTDRQKIKMLKQSTTYWEIFKTLENKGYGHISPPKVPMYSGHTNWEYKQELNDKFRKFSEVYKLSLFRSLAKVNNMLWTTMCQAQFPDKKFREIYFSYLFGRTEDMQLMHPYSSREALERKFIMLNKRYCCLPAGIEPEE